MRNAFLASIVFLFGLSLNEVKSQEGVEDFLNTYIDDNTGPFVQPLFELMTANLNTGLREWSAIDSSFYIRIGINVMSSYPSSAQRTFTAKTNESFEPFSTAEAPTIIGAVEPVEVDGVNGTSYIFPGGYNLKALPMASPQITIGGLFNTELSGRYFAIELDDNLGSLSLLGLGFRHAINPYFPKLPIDLSVGYYFHQFKDDPYINSKMHLGSLHIGKSGRWWSSQLMLGYQDAKTDLSYTYTKEEEVKMKELKIGIDNHFVAELSASLKLWILNIHGAINYSGPVTGALGLSLDF